MSKTKIDIPNGAWVVVADGQRALFLRNDGDNEYPSLQTVDVMEHDNPPTHEQGTDRPGRGRDVPAGAARDGTGGSVPITHRSAYEETDWHQQAEARFLGEVADKLKAGVGGGTYGKIVLVAPPKALGVLRKALDKQVEGRIIAEVGKDLTNQPVWDIARALTA